MADRIAVLSYGRVAFDDAAARVRADPAAVASLLSLADPQPTDTSSLHDRVHTDRVHSASPEGVTTHDVHPYHDQL